jgi:putative ABC transport system substrate-binding protein
MRRREFITLLGGAAMAWPRMARAQQPAKLPTVGVLASGTSSSHGRWVDTFVRRLSELGWIEGRTVAIELRWAEGRNERAFEIAAEFARRNVDVIVTAGTPTTRAANQATTIIPIVFVGASDPVGDKLVASLARPGGNITGLSNQTTDVAGKRLEFLRELVPNLRRFAILVNAGNLAAVKEMREARTAASTLGLEVVILEIQRAEDIRPALDGALKDRADALYVQGDLLTLAHRSTINSWALGARLPSTYTYREDVEAGGLMSYGVHNADLFGRAADFVDKILRGTKPADIPVEQPTKFELVINLKTARALGLTVPQALLVAADEVIE